MLLSQAAGLHEDKEVAQSQSYGPEACGGACRSEVVISDKAIDYIKTMAIDVFVVMSQRALDKYMHKIIADKTIIIADTTLIHELPANIERIYPLEATRIAEDTLGRSLFANIIMLGTFSAISKLTSLAALENSLEGNVPPKTLEKNLTALNKGYTIGEKLMLN